MSYIIPALEIFMIGIDFPHHIQLFIDYYLFKIIMLHMIGGNNENSDIAISLWLIQPKRETTRKRNFLQMERNFQQMQRSEI